MKFIDEICVDLDLVLVQIVFYYLFKALVSPLSKIVTLSSKIRYGGIPLLIFYESLLCITETIKITKWPW